jgi:hypothetical protein
MTLKPTDMLEIQSAIDEYERKFPRRPAPSAEVALAWRLGKKEWARRQASQQEAQPSVRGVESNVEETPDSVFAEQECSKFAWAWEQLRMRWLTEADPKSFESLWIKKVLMVGWWGAVAVMVASVFFFGAIVGGFK